MTYWINKENPPSPAAQMVEPFHFDVRIVLFYSIDNFMSL